MNSTKWNKAFYFASGISAINVSNDSMQYYLKSLLPSHFKQFPRNWEITLCYLGAFLIKDFTDLIISILNSSGISDIWSYIYYNNFSMPSSLQTFKRTEIASELKLLL